MNQVHARAAELHRRKILAKRQRQGQNDDSLSDILGGSDDEPAAPRPTPSPSPPPPPPAGGAGSRSSASSTQSTPPASSSSSEPIFPSLNPPTATSSTRPTSSTTPSTPTSTSTSISSSTRTSLSSSSSSSSFSSTTERTTSTTPATTSTGTTPVNTPSFAPPPSRSTLTQTLIPTRSLDGAGAAASATGTSASDQSSGAATGKIVGGVIGAIVGIAAVCIFVAFIIRRLRSRREEEDHFSAAQFRRSAVLLDDEFASDGRAGQIQRGNSIGSNRGGIGAGAGYGTSLRPPTMIERHMANTPAAPPATYGYGQSYDQYGQYGGYGSFQTGEIVNPAHDAAGYGMATGQSGSPDFYNDNNNAYLNRQPSGGHAAYGNYTAQGAYVDMDRMASPPVPGMSPPPAAATAATAAGHFEAQSSALASAHAAAQAGQTQGVQRTPSANANQKRPDTVYNQEDAYGGM